MKKKVFITGISSLIMQQLIPLINNSEYEIIGISRKPFQQTWGNVKIIQADISNLNLYEDHLNTCDLIIHAAAVTHSFNENEYYKINLNSTKKLVDKAKELNINSFIYISSNTANLENGGYAKSKYLAEKYLQENITNWQIFRISEIFGGTKNEGIEKLISTVLNKSYVLYPKDIPFKFSPIYINDVVHILHKNIFLKSEKNELVNINGNERFSFQEIITLIKLLKSGSVKSISISKKMMFLFMKLSKKFPFNIGIVPDQIKRLYGYKTYGITNEKDITVKLGTYVAQISNKN